MDNTNGTASDGSAGTNTAGSLVKNAVAVFSPFTIGSVDEINPLPITLLYFSAKRQNENTVLLKWSTATEINNAGFELEMSEDGLSYQKIAFVAGAGQSSSIRNYQHLDNRATAVYYRLKQINFDQTYSYSPVVFVDYVGSKVQVYPNPNNGTFSILVGKTQDVVGFKLINALGVSVYEQTPTNNSQSGSLSVLNLGPLPAGLYYLHTKVGGQSSITKVVITR